MNNNLLSQLLRKATDVSYSCTLEIICFIQAITTLFISANEEKIMRFFNEDGELEKANADDFLPSEQKSIGLAKVIKNIIEERYINFIPGKTLHSFVRKNPYNFGAGI